jgi:hypothetical protein
MDIDNDFKIRKRNARKSVVFFLGATLYAVAMFFFVIYGPRSLPNAIGTFVSLSGVIAFGLSRLSLVVANGQMSGLGGSRAAEILVGLMSTIPILGELMFLLLAVSSKIWDLDSKGAVPSK